ncbi:MULTISPECIES: benzoate 1,2-dioxygenase electron transfer component BenC [unclassified Nocardioides]|uniref:benzoate 1,2-dioxygenase electron transfer component BenC n=1 Tax=unclassified Nocardioides TaxID=2615069 RepID=UPI0006FE9AAC|nr:MULTISPECIES: benzoate 1,2-dioxygenase electron transfer component BenC [unclassified Nocardioides]KQY56870.1 oxidoreductase [Nocardioides sp. Root140]KQZ66934.1 oxidoreductase [Nocardioides sp. Root151]KRF12992.1 oxidoreductase [Nocardioides sp. Soil796]
MSHQVALSFEDGVTRFITVADDQTVADASYRARINIPLDCRDGACGTCKAFCESGEYDGGAYIDDALTADEAAKGYVLPCSMKAKSDLVLQIASTSAVAKTSAATYTATLTQFERLSESTVSFTLETPERSKLAFLPGQYVNLAVPGTNETRSYSFSNAPDGEGLTFLVKLAPGGLMSEHLANKAAVGDEMTFTGPNGSFFLREADRPLLLLAGGTGLAPILSILRKLRDCGTERAVHLVYGVSNDTDLVELETLEELAGQIPTLTWGHCVSDPETKAANQGYVMSLIEPEHLHGGDVAVYVCGPPPMVEAVRTHFADEGVEPTGFYYEKFALSGTPTAKAADPAPVVEAVRPSTPQEPSRDQAEDAAGFETGAGAPSSIPLVEEVAQQPSRNQADESLGLETGAGAPSSTSGPAGASNRLAGQEIFPAREVTPLHATAARRTPDEEAATARSIAGRQVAKVGSDAAPTPFEATDDEDLLVTGGRGIAKQEMFAAREIAPLHEPVQEVPAAAAAPPGTYEIGEEHPSVHESDALFEARAALELGALELVIGRLSSRQVTGYRLLAEATVPYVEGDRFVDAAAYTETNAAFHDYLFTLTGNEHLLQAYQALGVQGHMEDVLRHATWCHPSCTQDHLDIVDAFEAGDRVRARELITAHADRSKETTRRAMDEARTRALPKFITPGRFAGKVVVITGAAQGIGERTARRVSAEGGSVVLVDRSDLVGELAAEIGSTARPALPVVADLESWSGAESVVAEALRRFGRIDVLINNVGGAINFKPFTEFTDQEIRAELDRSLLTTLFTCRAVLPGMVERGRGVIINVSSAATRGIHRIPYSAAKGGINAITASLAVEYAEAGIRVAATAPGGTEAPPRRISRGTPEATNEQEQAWFQAHIDQTLDSSLMRRYGTLDEQAAAITFLASDEASYITGSTLPVAGGDLG